MALAHAAEGGLGGGDHPMLSATPKLARRRPSCSWIEAERRTGLMAKLPRTAGPGYPNQGGGQRRQLHPLPTVLTIALAATLAGARGYLAISEYAARLTQTQLKRLRAYFDRRQQRFVAPSEPTFRRVLQRHRIHLLEHAAEGGLGGGDEALLSAIEIGPQALELRLGQAGGVLTDGQIAPGAGQGWPPGRWSAPSVGGCS